MTRILVVAVLLASLAALVLPLDVAVLAWMLAAGLLMLASAARGLDGDA